jgi:hypothetical protein
MFTSDGYINNQSLTASIPYGRMDSSENGCGWIAAFNVLRHLEGKQPVPEIVAKSLLGGLVLWGYLGTWPFAIMRFLRGRGYAVRWSLKKSVQKQIAASSAASVLLYVGPFLRWSDFQLHYVMLYPCPGGRFRVLNFGSDPHLESLDDLASRMAGGTFTLLMGVTPPKGP